MTEYGAATLGNATTLMEHMIDMAEKYGEQLGADLAGEFTTLKANFTEARDSQVEKKGQVAESRESRDGARIELEDQLMDNLLTLAMENKRNPEVVGRHFDSSILTASRRGPAKVEEDLPLSQ